MLCPTACWFSANCLIGLSLITSTGRRDPLAQRLEPHRGPRSSPRCRRRSRSYGSSRQRANRSPPLSSSRSGSAAQHLPQVAVVLGADRSSGRRRSGRRARPGSRAPPAGSCSGCRSRRRSAPPRCERQEQRDGLRLEVDPRADRQAGERPRLARTRRRSAAGAGSCSITHSMRSIVEKRARGPARGPRSGYQLGTS